MNLDVYGADLHGSQNYNIGARQISLCYILSLDGLFDHIISISSVLEPSLPPSWLRLKNPLYTPSVTTLSIWMVTRPRVDFPNVFLLLHKMYSFCPFGGMSNNQVKPSFHTGQMLWLTTFVCLGGPFPICRQQNAFVPPIVCFKLFPRMMVTVKQPGKQCSKLSALS